MPFFCLQHLNVSEMPASVGMPASGVDPLGAQICFPISQISGGSTALTLLKESTLRGQGGDDAPYGCHATKQGRVLQPAPANSSQQDLWRRGGRGEGHQPYHQFYPMP